MNTIFIFCVLTLLMTIQADGEYDVQSDISLMNEIASIVREARSFGCNGPKDKNVYRCRQHCRNRNYKSGRCSKSSDYKRCVCFKSPDPKPKLI